MNVTRYPPKSHKIKAHQDDIVSLVIILLSVAVGIGIGIVIGMGMQLFK